VPSSISSGNGPRLLSLVNVEKSYGDRVVLEIPELHLDSHDFLLIVGGNGSGKSTLLRVLAGISDVSAGRLTFDESLSKLRACYVPQTGGLYQAMTLRRNMQTLRALYGSSAGKHPIADSFLTEFGLEAYLDMPSSSLSGGFQKIAAIACALMAGPRILFLDEPLTGIDPWHARKLTDALVSAASTLDLMVVTDHVIDRFSSATRIYEVRADKRRGP
jgi:ABC-type multidrug transport system ATPase subunit